MGFMPTIYKPSHPKPMYSIPDFTSSPSKRAGQSSDNPVMIDITPPKKQKLDFPRFRRSISPRRSSNSPRKNSIRGLNSNANYYIPAPVAMALDFIVHNRKLFVGQTAPLGTKELDDLEMLFLKGRKVEDRKSNVTLALGIVYRFLQHTPNPVIPGDVLRAVNRDLSTRFVRKVMNPAPYARYYYVMRMLARICKGDDQNLRALMLSNTLAFALTRSLMNNDKVAMIIKSFFTGSEQQEKLPELDDEAEKTVHEVLRYGADADVVVEGFHLYVTRSDISLLNGSNWLNDCIINFYMELIRERGEAAGRPKVHAFSSFFYNKMAEWGYESVKRWTRRVNILEKDFVLIPIILGKHWTLCIVDVRRKVVKHYNSLGTSYEKSHPVLQKVKEYLKAEQFTKQGTYNSMSDWQFVAATDVPLQENGSDCGVYICQYADYVTLNKSITFTQANMPCFRRRMIFEILTKKLLLK